VKNIEWSERARADIRALDRPTAMRIFEALTQFAHTGHGDLKRLKGEGGELRLRVGDWRVRLTEEPGNLLRIHSVLHRSEAYR